jgi:hypothetical protein
MPGAQRKRKKKGNRDKQNETENNLLQIGVRSAKDQISILGGPV